MTEEKTKKKTTSKKKYSDKITLSKKELTEAITDALLEYDKKKKEQEVQEYYAKKETEKLGFRKFMKLLFFPKKNLNTKDANVDIVRGFIKGVYKLFEGLLYFVSVVLTIVLVAQCFPQIEKCKWWVNILYGCGIFISFLIARVVRIMAIDVERNKDKNFLIALLAIIISIISVIVAVI